MDSKENMPFIDHLDEFRKRFFKVLVAHVIVMLLAFSQSGRILEKLMELNPEMNLIFIEPSEIMIVYVQIAIVVAVALCSPFTIYQLWGFVKKGLYEKEKRLIKIALGLGFVFFILGILFAYTVVVPMSLQFFTRIAIEGVDPMISVKSYISFILSLLLAMGIVFNIPSFVYVATKIGLITPEKLEEYNKYLIVAIFILAAALTPPDVVSQLMMATPMIILLRISMVVSKKTYAGMLKEKEKELEGKQ